MTTKIQKTNLLKELEGKKDGVPEYSISPNLDSFIEYLIREVLAEWKPCKDHKNLVLTAGYNRVKVQM